MKEISRFTHTHTQLGHNRPNGLVAWLRLVLLCGFIYCTPYNFLKKKGNNNGWILKLKGVKVAKTWEKKQVEDKESKCPSELSDQNQLNKINSCGELKSIGDEGVQVSKCTSIKCQKGKDRYKRVCLYSLDTCTPWDQFQARPLVNFKDLKALSS